MAKNVIFFRINRNFEETSRQEEKELAAYIAQNNIVVDNVIEIEVNAPSQEGNMSKLLDLKGEKDTLITYSLFSFGRTIESIVSNIKIVIENGFRINIINHNLELIADDMLTQIVLKIMLVASDMERELISLRTKEALTAKRNDGMSLGKPKGTIQKSKFDEQRDKIEELLSLGVSVRKIAKLLGFNNHIGINNYVKKRKIRDIVKNNNELKF